MRARIRYLSILWQKFEKTIVVFEIKNLRLVNYEFLTNKVNFDIDFIFYKDSGSIFSESIDPGPLYAN